MALAPSSPEAVVDRVVDAVLARAEGHPVRVAVDGAPPTLPEELADALVGPLRAAGRPVARISATDFLRPRSLRWERGREDPDALYDDWLDEAALAREVLTPCGPGGTGWYLPALWDPVRERSYRAQREHLPPEAVVVLDGTLLLGRGLDLDLTVHLSVRPATLERITPEQLRWTLPAYARYSASVAPEAGADVVVHVDDRRHPALRLPG